MVTTRARSSTAPQTGLEVLLFHLTEPGTPLHPLIELGPPAPSSMVGSLSATIPDEADILRHVVTNVLKQPSDGPLAQALDEAGINDITDLLTLDHRSRNTLTYKLDDGTVKPLPIGYKHLLRMLKIFADYCQDMGMPLKIGPQSPRETLMTSGPAMQD